MYREKVQKAFADLAKQRENPTHDKVEWRWSSRKSDGGGGGGGRCWWCWRLPILRQITRVLDSKAGSGPTRLHLATQQPCDAGLIPTTLTEGLDDLRSALVPEGVDVNARDPFGWSPLLCALQSQSPGALLSDKLSNVLCWKRESSQADRSVCAAASIVRPHRREPLQQ